MCGIVGMVSGDDVVQDLVDGLRRLEYRGYDSAGVAVVTDDGRLERVRAAGKIGRLQAALGETPVSGRCGIGHTRWATHGRPTDANAHPHTSCDGQLAIVHNGIIENFQELRSRLEEKGHRLSTETDTEVLAHLIGDRLESGGFGGEATTLIDAVTSALSDVRGVHALAAVRTAEPDRIVVSTNGPPALVGLGDGASVVASDLAAILPHARRVVFLEEGDTAVVTADSISVVRPDGAAVERAPRTIEWNPIEAEKAGYKHFMLKEIHEQPGVLEEGLIGHVSPDSSDVSLDGLGLSDEELRSVERIVLLGCGTAYHAAMVGARLIETLARVPCDHDVASEFRYRDPILAERTLTVAVTQSGETADTLGAMKEARAKGSRLVAVCNVLGSLATRLADGTLHTRAGMEIGVASTKAFTCQILALTLLAIRLGQLRGTLDASRSAELVAGLRALPRLVEEALHGESRAEEIARATAQLSDYLYLGRGILHPLAMEGALKLKEISYIHAEGYPAGEMKHGPIALIDEKMPIVGLCPQMSGYEKTAALDLEIIARCLFAR